MTTSRSAAQAAASARNGARSSGPKSPIGRRASSLSAVRHGLSAKNLLLPGEDEHEYETFLSAWATTLGPASLAEATIVAQIADAGWRLERLSKIESGRVIALLEEKLSESDLSKSVAQTRRAHQALEALVAAITARPTPPAHVSELVGFLGAVRSTIDLINGISTLSPSVAVRMEMACAAVEDSEDTFSVNVPAYTRLSEVARELADDLAAHLAEEAAQLVPLREQLAAEVLLLDDADLRRLDRHRKLLETSMARQLGLLQQVRQTAATRPSSGVEGRDHLVRLRIVKP